MGYMWYTKFTERRSSFNAVCGHPSIVHGGALSAVFDDVFGALFVASRQGNGFTANLNVNYRKPVMAGTNLVIEARIDRIETGLTGSRKVHFSGTLRDRDDQSILYTEASALFVVKTVPSSDAVNRRIALELSPPIAQVAEITAV
jgi:acyl-coenzyme A thioesterase PaaI-like protein